MLFGGIASDIDVALRAYALGDAYRSHSVLIYLIADYINQIAQMSGPYTRTSRGGPM